MPDAAVVTGTIFIILGELVSLQKASAVRMRQRSGHVVLAGTRYPPSTGSLLISSASLVFIHP